MTKRSCEAIFSDGASYTTRGPKTGFMNERYAPAGLNTSFFCLNQHSHARRPMRNVHDCPGRQMRKISPCFCAAWRRHSTGPHSSSWNCPWSAGHSTFMRGGSRRQSGSSEYSA